jgi:hypothetical protein
MGKKGKKKSKSSSSSSSSSSSNGNKANKSHTSAADDETPENCWIFEKDEAAKAVKFRTEWTEYISFGTSIS